MKKTTGPKQPNEMLFILSNSMIKETVSSVAEDFYQSILFSHWQESSNHVAIWLSLGASPRP